MRMLLAAVFALLPLAQAQESSILKTVEPDYAKYNADLATDFNTASATVTLTILATGEPLSLDKSSVPLPLAVVMALKEYQFRPQGTIPHGRPQTEGDTYQVTLNVPIRESKNPVREGPSVLRIRSGISKALLVTQVRPEYSDYARHNRIRGTVRLQAVITDAGTVDTLQVSTGPFALIEAAYDAVKRWQYRPYRLNGATVGMLTEIEVNFNSL